MIGITQHPPREGAWSALFSNLSKCDLDKFVVKRPKRPFLEEVSWSRLPFLIWQPYVPLKQIISIQTHYDCCSPIILLTYLEQKLFNHSFRNWYLKFLQKSIFGQLSLKKLEEFQTLIVKFIMDKFCLKGVKRSIMNTAMIFLKSMYQNNDRFSTF